MGKKASITFTDNGTFVVPAGVTRVRTISAPANANGYGATTGAGTPTIASYFIDNSQNMNSVGFNGTGQLGDGSTVTKSSPVLVSGGNKWLKLYVPLVSSTSNTSDPTIWAQDTNGVTWAWGVGGFGQLGNGSVASVSSPVLVITSPGVLYKQFLPVSLDAPGSELAGVLALDTNGQAWGWGRQYAADPLWLGVGPDVGIISSPVPVLGSHVFTKLFCALPTKGGGSPFVSAWALDTAGALWGWGTNIFGILGVNSALGVGAGASVSSPTLVAGAATYSNVFTQPIAGANAATFFLDTSKNLWSSGSNQAGQLGIGISPGVTAAISSPALVVGGIKWAAMAKHFQTEGTVSFNSWCGIDTSGNAWTWGSNTSGALAQGVPAGTTAAKSSPTMVAGTAKFSQVFTICNTSGNQSFWGIDTSGQVWAWGDNADGILGVGDLINRSSPTLISFPAGFGRIQNIQNSTKSIIANDDKGHIYTWGFNLYGQLGNNVAASATPQLSSPVLVSGSQLYATVRMDEGSGSVYALGFDGNMYAWGRNTNGNLGIGNATSKSTPTLVVGGKNFSIATPQTVNDLTVTPGASIPILMRGSSVFFNGIQIGVLGDTVVIEFEQ